MAAFKTQTGAWTGALQVFAIGTFALLAAIQFAWSMIRTALSRHDMSEVLGELLNQAIFLGFFSFMMLNAASFGGAIIDTFRFVAGQAGGTAVTPGEFLALGIRLATQSYEAILALPWSAIPGAIICCIVILVLFALMSAQLLVTGAKALFWINAGVFYFGFGGSVWTKDYAISMVRHLVAVGAELFALQMLLSLCMGLIRSWVAAPVGGGQVTMTSVFVQIAVAAVMMVMVWEIPKEAQRIISGSSVTGPGLVGATAALTASVAAGAAAMVGAGAVLTQAVRLASAQVAAASKGEAAAGGGAAGDRSRIAHAAAVTGQALSNLATAPAADVGRRLSGQGARHGSAPWRMAADMGNQARLLSGDAGKPMPAAGSGSFASSSAAGPRGGGASYEPWMSQTDGFASMTPEHQASAQRSYAQWEQGNPEAAQKYGLHSYVNYVQEKQAEREGRNE